MNTQATELVAWLESQITGELSPCDRHYVVKHVANCLARAKMEAVEAERQACATIAEHVSIGANRRGSEFEYWCDAGRHAAQKIRERWRDDPIRRLTPSTGAAGRSE